MRRRHLVIAVLAVLTLAPSARAATVSDYTPQAFAAAQAAGEPILVHISAGWCPTCAVQRPILAQLEAKPECRDLQVFRVDFDSQKDAVRAFGARMQSTLIAFHGKTETARSVGQTDPGKIAAVVESALR
ncbi:MAG: thioredoxin family protein [Rhodospirillales bacterium]|nr:thioredoxin family protein [Rhodospirillales bacterium]